MREREGAWSFQGHGSLGKVGSAREVGVKLEQEACNF